MPEPVNVPDARRWNRTSPENNIPLQFLTERIIGITIGHMDSRTRILFICLAQFLPEFLFAIPIVAPLICWLIWKDDADPQVADYARRRLNTNISWTLWFLAAGLLCYIFVGFILIIALGIIGLIAIIKDLIRASQGDTSYIFPFTVEFIRSPQA